VRAKILAGLSRKEVLPKNGITKFCGTRRPQGWCACPVDLESIGNAVAIENVIQLLGVAVNGDSFVLF
jgi:hypothetical protein